MLSRLTALVICCFEYTYSSIGSVSLHAFDVLLSLLSLCFLVNANNETSFPSLSGLPQDVVPLPSTRRWSEWIARTLADHPV
jgi:hypothetical protein